MNPVKKIFQLAVIATVGIIALTGCSGGEDRDAKTATSALINENKNIVAFGHISVQQLLDKLDYKHLPKAGALLSGELSSWESSVDFSKPVYFAVQAPFALDGSPELTYMLFDVKDRDSLIDKFNGMGYESTESGDIQCFNNGDVGIGIRNTLAILLIKGGSPDFTALLKTAFEQTEGDESTGKTQKILSNAGDIVTGLNIERLFTTANTSLNKLPADKQKTLNDLVADGYIQTVTNFEKGKVTMKASNMFNDKLKDLLFFKEDPKASVVKKLGSGNAWMGMSANVDVNKMESFLADFAPEGQKKLNAVLPGEAAFALAMMGENPFTQMFSGQFGLVFTGNPRSSMGMIPQFNFFLGLGKKGEFINEQASMYATLMGLQKQGDAFITEGMAIAPRKDGLYGFTLPENKSGSLKIPSFAKDFGKKTFSMFIDFGQIDVKSLELEDEMKVLEIMDTFYVTVDREGTDMVMTTKSNSANILKQIGQFYAKLFEEKMGDMAI
ncbi:MAG TPA: hypothetical protein VK151_00830 [Fluviicola sp.]|nr:hypothetical protein [Fluviicola sp.]